MSQRPTMSIRDLLSQLRDQTVVLVAAGLLSLVAAVGLLWQPLLVRSLIEAISKAQPAMPFAILLVGLLLVAGLCSGLRDYLLQRVAEGLILKVRCRLASHVLRLPMTEYERRRTGDLLSRIGADSALLRGMITNGLFGLVTSALTAVGATVAVILIDPLLFAVMCAGLSAGLAAAATIGRRTRSLAGQVQNHLGEMTSALERGISGVRTIRAARAEAREAALIAASARKVHGTGVRLAKVRALVVPVSNILLQGTFLLVLGIGGARVASGAMAMGDLVAFVLFLLFLIVPLGQIVGAYTEIQVGIGSLQRVHELLRLPVESDQGHGDDGPAQPRADTAALEPTHDPAIHFDRVTFGYEPGNPVLRDVSFHVPAGALVALVGPSGAGKSTLLALLERFYEVRSGRICIGGVDIRDRPHERLRAHLGYLEQEAPLLAGTIRENLLLTAPDATDQELIFMLEKVNLGELLRQTSSGLDTKVGEGGVLLSGGQRQRLAIARTLLANPSVLLLDEPTSHLDARNERVFRRIVQDLAPRHTMLIAAHRLSTVMGADRIVVLERGRVVAIGRHDELMESSPLYQELTTSQLLTG